MTSLIEPNIHPILVHFAYALSVTAVVCYLISGLWSKRRESLRAAADWMLALGALAIIATIAAGFQAYYSVGHDSPSHTAMTTHRNWAVPSGSVILVLAIWRWIDRAKPVKLLFKTLVTLAALSLTVTAWWGGHIVYNYGLGVKSLPVVTGDGHDHEHGISAQDTDEASKARHDNTDEHHEAVETEMPIAHDNSDGHHDQDSKSMDDKEIKSIISSIQKGWEEGDGTPFRANFLDYEGARYFESGGQNTGLSDLVENHVEPEKDSIPDLKLGLSDLAIHYEVDFAWAVASTTVKGTVVSSGRVLDRTGKQTWLFRKVGGEWKVIHTHSSSRAKRN